MLWFAGETTPKWKPLDVLVPPRPYQREAMARWDTHVQVGGKAGIIVLPTGCVDGEATIRVARFGKSFNMKLRDLHEFHQVERHSGVPTFVRSMIGNVVRRNELIDSKFSGYHETIRIKTQSGKSICVTQDHEIATPFGWIQAQNLFLGDLVLVNKNGGVRPDKIVAIAPAGVKAVYDLICTDPHRSFIANGIVVHNSGKTLLGILIGNARGRTLWIAHRDELIQQPFIDAQEYLKQPSVGIVKAERNEVGAKHLVIASIQTIRQPHRLEALLQAHIRDPFTQIIVDEVHHACAPSYEAVLGAFPDVPRLGLTATPIRSDKKGLAKAWGSKPIFRMSLRDAIEQGYLVDFTSRRVQIDGLHLERLLVTAENGDFNQEALDKEMVRTKVAESVAEVAEELVKEGRKIIVFTVSVNQSCRISELLNKKAIAAATVSYMTATSERRAHLENFKRGTLRVICNSMILTEGFNDTAVDCAVIARPTLSPGLYTQMLGRILRRHPGKENALVVDIVGATDVNELVTADTLDLDQPEGEKRGKREDEGGDFVDEDGEWKKVRGFIHAVAATQEDEQKKQKPRKKKARVVWLQITDRFWALSAGKHGHLLVIRESEDDHSWMGYQLEAESWNLLERKPILLQHTTLDIACGVVEDRAREMKAFVLSDADADWRQAAPTDQQIRALEAMGEQAPPTRGQASDRLTIAKMAKMMRSYEAIQKAIGR